MPTVNSTGYTEIATSAALAQNRSAYRVRVVMATSLPAASETEYFILPPEEAVTTQGSNNLYAMCDKEGETAHVVVAS